MTYVFLTVDEKVVTWRSGWPCAELERRGYPTALYATAAGIPQPRIEATDDDTYILHMVNRSWQIGDRVVTFVDVARDFRQVGRLVLSIDDDWTRMLMIQHKPIPQIAREVHARIPELVKLADRVIVATPRLKEIFSKWNSDVRVVPNTIPEAVIGLPRPPRLERIMWMGEMYIHGMDWDMLQPHAKDLPPLYLVGAGEKAGQRVKSWGAKSVMVTEAILDQWALYSEIGRGVAAIVPLKDTPFNRGKSWSKPMEFMARGVQPIASSHAEYERLDDLTRALPTYDDPAQLVKAINEAWDNRKDVAEQGEELPQRLRDARLTMETGGGDAWEEALS